MNRNREWGMPKKSRLGDWLKKLLLDDESAPTLGGLEQMSSRSSFSKYLPWIAYDENEKIYVNDDESLGFIWECVPYCFASESIADKLAGIFGEAIPLNTVISFHLFADDDIEPILTAFTKKKTRDLPIFKEAALEFTDFLRSGKEGVDKMAGIPTRHFRLFVSIKLPWKEIQKAKTDFKGLRSSLEQKLQGAGLNPVDLEPGEFLGFLRRLFNDDAYSPDLRYARSPNQPLRDQVILAETRIQSKMEEMILGDRHFVCQTVNKTPNTWNTLRMNKVIGGIEGIVSDTGQINTPFLLTVNLIYRDLRKSIHGKLAIVNKQNVGEHFGKTLLAMRSELEWAIAKYEEGGKFVLCQPMIWTWSRDKNKLDKVATRIKTLWKNESVELQKDKGILPILLISALPLGLKNIGKNVENMQRDFPLPVETAVRFLPTQGDFSGVGIPTLLFLGRKGQVTMMDVTNKQSTNMNGFIAAGSGGGKSFLNNSIVFNYYGNGAKVRIVDIGASYKKMAVMVGATYMDFTPSQDICVNPFGFIVEKEVIDQDEEGQDEAVLNLEISIETVAAIIGMMAIPGRPMSPREKRLLQDAVRWSYEKKGKAAIIDDAQYFLDNLKQCYGYLGKNLESELGEVSVDFKKEEDPILEQWNNDELLDDNPKPKTTKDSATKLHDSHLVDMLRLGHQLAYNLYDFSSKGKYAKFFCRPSNFDISKDEFVILELDYLKPQEELFRVITTIVINAVTVELYLSDRKDPRLIIFDEAWQFMSPGSLIMQKIVEGYRRARKYNGCFWVITQSIMDMERWGEAGDVINANASYKFYLASTDFEKAKEKKLIDFDPFTMQILKSIATKRGDYSEIFMKTDKSFGVARLCIDPFNYWVYTSDPEEVHCVEQLVGQGKSYPEAIRWLIAKASDIKKRVREGEKMPVAVARLLEREP